jgi:hypothetical protein
LFFLALGKHFDDCFDDLISLIAPKKMFARTIGCNVCKSTTPIEALESIEKLNQVTSVMSTTTINPPIKQANHH